MALISLTDARRAVYMQYERIAGGPATGSRGLHEELGTPNSRRLVLDGEERETPPTDPWAAIVVTNTIRRRMTIGKNPLIRQEGNAFFQLYLPMTNRQGDTTILSLVARLEAMADQIIHGIPDAVPPIPGFDDLPLRLVEGDPPDRKIVPHFKVNEREVVGRINFGICQPTERPPRGEYAEYVVEVPYWYEQRKRG